MTSDILDFALGNPQLFKLMFDEGRKPGVSYDAMLRRPAAGARVGPRREATAPPART
jgi:hypothetical protein